MTEEYEPQAFSLGVKYNREPHPHLKKWSTKGWIEVRGCDRSTARTIVYGLFGDSWAFQYDVSYTDGNKHFPDGPFLVIVTDDKGMILSMNYT